MMSRDKFKHQVRGQVLFARQIYFVARRNFYVASVVTLYHDCETSKCCDRCIFSLTACDLLCHAASCCAAFFQHVIKYLFHENLCPDTF